MKITLTTGYGYVQAADGKVLYTYRLPPREHDFPEGTTVVEVADATALAGVTVYRPEPTRAEKIALINTDYLPRLHEAREAWLDAFIGDATLQEIQAAKAAFKALLVEYKAKLAAI